MQDTVRMQPRQSGSRAEHAQPNAGRDYLQGMHRNEASSFTDVQVQRLEHDHEPGTSPGHYQQP